MTVTIRSNEERTLEYDKNSIIQNIYVMLNTWKGDVPLYPDFGIDRAVLHRPINEVRPFLLASVTDLIRTYEPEVEIKKINFEVDGEGALVVIVEVEINV